MTTKLTFLLALCLVLGALMVACGGGADNTATTNSGTTNSATTNTSTASGDKVGVPECDDFIAKYEACVNGKVPEAARATVKTSLETWRKSWKELAATPQGKAGLATACKAASDQAKQSMTAYGCSW
jgi:hypothetical protein